MTKKEEKEERKEEENSTECPNKDCDRCDAQRRYEIAKLNAELIIEEAEKRESC